MGGKRVQKDIYLTRWSNVLAAMAVLAGVVTALTMIYPLIFDGPIVLAKAHGAEIWKMQILDMPVFERLTVLLALYMPSFAWLYIILHIFRLARNYRTGQIFGEVNACGFVRIGVALALMGLFQTIDYPFINHFLNWRGITPWLGEMPLVALIRPDMFMAGLFFYVLGKIVRRASDLEESDRLVI
jgi:hypothetical protein